MLISDCRQELMILQPAFPVLDGMLADAPKRQQHYLHFQPFSATYRWFIKGDGSSTELTYFYPFFARTLIIDSVVQPSIVEAHMRNPEATLKRLHLSLSPTDQEQLQRRHFTFTQDLQQFSKGCNRDGLRASLVLHTSWAQYTEFVLQRNLLFEEMLQVKLSPRNMPQLVACRLTGQQPQCPEELEFVRAVLEVCEFCYTIEDILVLRFLLLSERCRLLHERQALTKMACKNLLIRRLDTKVPEDFDPAASRFPPSRVFQSLRLKNDVILIDNDDSWLGHNIQMARLVPSSKPACADKLTQTEHVLMQGSGFDRSHLTPKPHRYLKGLIK